MEKNLDYQVVLGLKKDLSILQSKMAKALGVDNIGTYSNLQKALVNSLNAIKELSNEYKLMYSEYTTGEEKQRQVAVWEQNSNGDIKNHKVWNVEGYGLKSDVLTGKIKRDNLQFYKEWEERFIREHILQNNKTKFNVGKDVRNIGKTTFLVKQAVKNNGLYVGASKLSTEYAKTIDKDVMTCYGGSFTVYDTAKLYIDEGVDVSLIVGLDMAAEYFMFCN